MEDSNCSKYPTNTDLVYPENNFNINNNAQQTSEGNALCLHFDETIGTNLCDVNDPSRSEHMKSCNYSERV